jgi:hypothetical protein
VETKQSVGPQALTDVTPVKIMQIGMGFWASKVLLTAVKLRLFTSIGPGRVAYK